MARMTGGSASYLQRRKIGDFEWKEFQASITWSADDGDDIAAADAMIERAGSRAVAEVHFRLGLGEGFYREPKAPAAEPKIDGRSAAARDAKQTSAPKIGSVAAIKAAAAAAMEQAKAKPPADDDLIEDTPTPPLAGASVTVSPPSSSVIASVDDDLTVDEPVREITSAEISSAVNRLVEKHKNSREIVLAIRQLRDQYGVPQVAMIPADKRQAFLDGLAQLG